MLVVLATEYTQSGNSRVHSIMMEKLAKADEGRGACPPPFTLFTITNKVAVYAPAERADTLTLFHLYSYMYSVVLAVLCARALISCLLRQINT